MCNSQVACCRLSHLQLGRLLFVLILLEFQFGHNVQLEKLKIGRDKERESFIEDRKDERTRISGTQQSKMISQRKNDMSPTNFTETENPEGLDLSAFNMS